MSFTERKRANLTASGCFRFDFFFGGGGTLAMNQSVAAPKLNGIYFAQGC